MGKQNLGRNASFTSYQSVILLSVISISVLFALYVWRKPKLRALVRKKQRTIFIVSAVALTLGGAALLSSEAVIQFVDLSILRSHLLHDFFQTSKDHTLIPRHEELIVFQHLPRTAGDSMRTHAFHNVSIDFTPLWESWKSSPPKPYEWDPDVIHKAAAIKGYWSKNDIDNLRSFGRPLKVFTVLRHPIERALSFYDFAGHGTAEEFFDFESELFKNPENGERMYEHIASFANNGMTWQFGGQMHVYHRNISEAEALERAKRELDSMEFVGFYENLGADFWHIHKTIFADTQVPLVYPLAFYLGSVIGLPRLRVAKYSKMVDQETLKKVLHTNQLDLELYQYARKKFNQNYNLYDNYVAFTLHYLPMITLAGLLLSGLLLFLVWCCCRCCKKNHCRTLNNNNKNII